MAINKPHPFFTHRKRAAVTSRYQRYHVNKVHPKRVVMQLVEDMGKVKQVTRVSWPEDAPSERTIIPSNPNPDMIKLLTHPFKIVYYRNSGKYFAYDEDGRYIASLERHDLLNLWANILEHLGTYHVHNRRKRVEVWGICRKHLLHKHKHTI